MTRALPGRQSALAEMPATGENLPGLEVLIAGAILATGGDTVSTEAVAARRHAGRHLPAIGWNNTTGNSQLALAA
jgi:hypothetical protein